MGEDIHQKTFAKSKKTGKYINVVELISSQDFEHSAFKELVPDRFYNLYSCFGSRRADWKELSCLEYGTPPWFAEQFPTENAIHDKMGCSYYGYCWCTLPKLKACLQEYVSKLDDPAKYYDGEDDDYEREMLEDPDEREPFIEAWKEDAANIKSYMEEMLKKIEEIEQYGQEDWMQDIFDPNEVVFMFWFDN